MKKSLIALAVASAVSAPAFAATANVDIYGRMAFSVDYVDTNNLIGDGADVVTGRDNVSRFGIKGTEDLGNGLAAIWQVETQLNTATTTGGTSLRNTFIGLSSKSLGTVLLGRHDTPYKLATGNLDIFSDTAGDYNTIIGTTGAQVGTTAVFGSTIYDNRAPQMIAYMSPTWTGFSFAAAYAETKNVEAGAGDNQQGFSTMAKYVNGPIFASLAYETFSGAAGGGSTATADTEAYKAGLGVKLGALQLGAVYEMIDSSAAASANERDAYYMNAMYSIGAIDLKAAYGMAKDGESAASTEMDYYVVGADYNLSKRTKLFGLYTTLANGGGTNIGQSTTGYAGEFGQDVEIISVGAVHTF